jgi:hypothetical protein
MVDYNALCPMLKINTENQTISIAFFDQYKVCWLQIKRRFLQALQKSNSYDALCNVNWTSVSRDERKNFRNEESFSNN